MTSRTDTTWLLPDNAFLSICAHPPKEYDEGKFRASLSHPAYCDEGGRGFTIFFTAAHIPTLSRLIETLKNQEEPCETESQTLTK